MPFWTAACDREEGVPLTLASAAPEPEFVPVDYRLTSDAYRKWLAAQENLRRDATDADLGLPAERILLTNPTRESIDDVVSALEANARTRDAIESAGLSVREYVLATLAIYQATDRPDTLDFGPGGTPIPTQNIELVSANSGAIAAARAASPVRIVSDAPRARGGKGKGHRGKGRGRGKGRR